MDHVSGFVLKVDLFQAKAEGRSERTLAEFKRPLHTIPNTQNLSDLFNSMIADQIHIAATLDEFGSFAGLITLEDVIETLLGIEIIDEVDDTEDMQQKARDLWKKRAKKMGIELAEFDTTEDDSNV
jgi:CBS domain containing-hemolysin-like protein